jgi:hypothetical protein
MFTCFEMTTYLNQQLAYLETGQERSLEMYLLCKSISALTRRHS